MWDALVEEVFMGQLRMEPKVRPIRFVEITPSQSVLEPQPKPITLHLGGLQIEIPAGFHHQTLAEVLDLLDKRR